MNSMPHPSLPPLSSRCPWGRADTVFDRLEGVWTLNRIVEYQATVAGVAEFQRLSAHRLKYREEGEVRLADGNVFSGYREYLFERGPDGFLVFFAEDPPRLFHRIALIREGDTLAASATHHCAADHYDSLYQFLLDGSFVIQHIVNGPCKAYTSRTRFMRRSR
jgi:hypothetical protein